MSRDEAARPVGRRGEELDAASVDAWLKPRVPGLDGAPRVTQYSGGASNWTYRLEYPTHDLVLRRPPSGTKAKSAHDMGREFRVQRALAPVFPYVPEMIAHCEDASVIGADFYVMRRLDGVVPRAKLGVTLDRQQTRALCHRAIDTLVALHKVDAERAGLASLGKGSGYTRRQIEGWTERGRRAQTWNSASFRLVTEWLAANTPDDVRTCVVHNDFRLDNLVLDPQDPTRIVGVLDWEMATLGDPLMDLGTALGYWVEADDPPILYTSVAGPTNLPGNLTRTGIVERWSRATGRDASNVTFYYAFALFKLGIIKQQLYKRWLEGLTTDERFGGMLEGVRAVSTAALLAVEKGRIDRLAD